jgi:hypothetical protein
MERQNEIIHKTSGFLYINASGVTVRSDHGNGAGLSGGLHFGPRRSVFKTEPVFPDLQFG